MEIHEINQHNSQDGNLCENAFTVKATLIPIVTGGMIRYTLVDTKPYEKRYPPDNVDYSSYIENPTKTAFFAYVDSHIAGEMRLCRWWNGYAYVENIVVDTKYRRSGVGHKLLQHGIQWAKARKLAGVMVETQNNNVAACRFYEDCGFELGGFDKYLYRGLNAETEEIALYWYLFFKTTA